MAVISMSDAPVWGICLIRSLSFMKNILLKSLPLRGKVAEPARPDEGRGIVAASLRGASADVPLISPLRGQLLPKGRSLFPYFCTG